MMNETLTLKKIPYGVSDFNEFRVKNLYYVDKTRFIRVIEEKGSYLFLIRPRRFGKSLFLAILEAYYDIAYKDRFDELFKGTDIHQNPTREKNSYMILTLDFSQVSPDISRVEDTFIDYIKESAYMFILKYEKLLDIDPEKAKGELFLKKNAAEVMLKLLNYCKRVKQKLYTIIDEYDNFANTILSEAGEQAYQGITHGKGFFRAFFNVLKGGTSRTNAPISRLFMSGVSPITMDDVTSGFNIAANITMDPDLSDIMGFTRAETETILEYYRQTGKILHSTPELMEIMSQWYNHYRYSIDSDIGVFNTVHVLYFLQQYLIRSKIPHELVDRNAQIDYKKLRHLIIVDKKGKPMVNGNFSQLRQILETGQTIADIQSGFPIDELEKPGNFISLLFYFGLLTVSGTTLTGQTILSIPNEFVRRLFYDFIRDTYEDTKIFSIDMPIYAKLLEDFAVAGKWEPFIQYIAGRMEASLGIRDLMTGEKALQVFWNVYLGLNSLYIVYPEKELNQGFADLALMPMLIRFPGIKYSYLVELKYIKPSGNEPPDPVKLQELGKEAEAQLNRYSRDEKFQKSIGGTTLKKLVLIFSGNRMVYHNEIGF
jgi:hypothetical protein